MIAGVIGCAALLVIVLGAWDYVPAVAQRSPPGSPASPRSPASDPDALRIVVERRGPVAVGGAELVAAGWQLADLRGATLTLTSGGRPVPAWIHRAPGSSSEALGARDHLVFYGVPATGQYTRENIYWLQRREPAYVSQGDQTVLDRPMPTRNAAPDRDAPVTQFVSSVRRFERDTVYIASMPAGLGDDRWMWGEPIGAGTGRTFELQIPGVLAADQPAELHVELQGYTDDRSVDGDHHIRLHVGGRTVADALFDGRSEHVLVAALDPDVLSPNVTELVVESLGDTGAVVDLVYVDRITLRAALRPHAVDGQLSFGLDSLGDANRATVRARTPSSHGMHRLDRHARTVAVEGFASSDLAVLDIRRPSSPVRLEGVEIVSRADGRWAVHFTDTAGDPARAALRLAAGRAQTAVLGSAPGVPVDPHYVAVDVGSANRPGRIERNHPSTWKTGAGRPDPTIGADWIAVAHPTFITETRRLAAHRRARGLRTAVVDVQDVYDEFSHGVYHPSAIRAFVDHAWRTWEAPAPRFLVLVGAANLDHRGGYEPSGRAARRFVPAPRVDVAPGGPLATVTDDTWYAQLVGDDPVPELHVGRLPVATVEEARTVVDKILAYERAAEALSVPRWRRRTLWVADDDGAASFEPFSEGLIQRLPSDHSVRRFYAAGYDRGADLSADIRDAIEDGALAINFTGHGNVDLWSPWPGGGRIFENADIGRLANGLRLPVLTAATCMNGFIDNPVKPISMSERWLTQPDGGGIAAWAPSGFTHLGAQREMLGTFYAGLYDGRGRPIGELATAARAAAWDESHDGVDVIRQFVLVGDPATVVSGVALADGPTAAPSTPSATPGGPTPSTTGPPRETAIPAWRTAYLPRLVGGGQRSRMAGP